MAAEKMGETHLDKEYAKKLAVCLNEFRKKNIMCDVILSCYPNEYFCHRNVLCAASLYFLEIFNANAGSQPTLGSRVELRDISSKVIEDVLNFMYLGEICVGEENVTELIAASDILKMSDLKAIACRYYEKKLSPSNCLSIASLADKFNCESLRQAADKFVFYHFMDVCKYQEFKTLNCSQVIRILSANEIVVESEENIYFAAMEWLHYDFNNRNSFISNLMKCVRFVQTSKYFILDVCERDETIIGSKECLDIIEEAKYILNYPDRKHVFKYNNFNAPRDCLDYAEVIVACGGNQERMSANEVICYVPEKNFWYPLAPLHHTRFQSSSVTLNNTLYCIGGKNEDVPINNIEQYQFSTDSWMDSLKLPNPISNHVAVIFNGEIHIIGGEINGKSTSQVLRYSVNLGKWIKLHDMKVPRKALAVAVHKRIYAIGGYGPNNDALASVECFDPYLNEWSKLFPMNSPRAGASAVCVENKIYVFGGEYAMWSYYRSAEVFDILTDEWKVIADLSIPRSFMGIAHHKDSIYLAGGMVSADDCDQYGVETNDEDDFVDVNETKLVESYNIVNNSYTRLCSLPLQTAGANCGVISTCKVLLKDRLGY